MNSIGRYQLLEKLGQGGMGVVYRAFDTLLHRVVAVKVIAGAVDSTGEQRERFFREARAAGQLSHRNIITIHDLGEHEGQPYLAMEYLEGEDLQRRLMRPERMSVVRKIELAIEICLGLEYAHARGVVHRDIKPANIFITDDGTVKILDFGLARLVTSQLTNSNMMMGTINYMAPEQVRGERADHRSDIFSVGVVLYELLGGRKAFDGESFATTLYNILQSDPESLLNIEPSLPPDLVAIVERALAKPRDERYQQMSELLTDLVVCRQQFAAYDSPAGRPSPFASGRRSDPPRAVPPSVSDAPVSANVSRSVSQPAAGELRAVPLQGPAGGAAPQAPRSMGGLGIAAGAVLTLVVALAIWAMRTPEPASRQGSAPEAPAAVVDQGAVATAPKPIEASPETSPGQGADGARTRMDEAKEAARAANAVSLANPAYRAALAVERAAEQLYGRGKFAEAAAKFYEASGLFRSAQLSAQSEAAARAGRAAAGRSEKPPQPINPAANASAIKPREEPARIEPSVPPVTVPTVPSPPSRPPAESPANPKGGERGAASLPGTGTPVTAPPPPPPAAPPEPSAESLIMDLLARYDVALESRSLSALKRLWPGLSGSQESAMRDEFAHANRLVVDIVAPRVEVSGDTATATFTRRYEILTVDGQRFTRASLTTMRLRRGGSGWIIEQVRFEPVR